MNKYIRFFFSPSVAVILLLAFAISMAAATFIENDFGTLTARVMVYNAWWFEMLMVYLCLIFISNIFKYRLHEKGKFPVLLFHLAFIIVLLGAGITRFTAYEGVMRIREGQSSNTIISDRNFLQLTIHNKTDEILVARKELYFSPLKENDFSWTTSFLNDEIQISFKEFIPDAQARIIDVQEGGEAIIELTVSDGKGRETHFLKQDEVKSIGRQKHQITFQNEQANAVNVFEENGQLKIRPIQPITFFEMDTQRGGNLTLDSLQVLNYRTLYRRGDLSFVINSYHPQAIVAFESLSENLKDNDENKDDVLLLNISSGEVTKEVKLIYRHGFLPISFSEDINNIDLSLSYGAIPLSTPFNLKLIDFQLERYPGSTSPSSYASEVSISDGTQQIPYRIFMNHVLDYKGYRFFQASYDSDEKGTVLSVSHDRMGTLVSYFGYVLLGIGMLWTLFGKGSRFSKIQRKLKALKLKKNSVACVLLLMTLSLNAQHINTDSIIKEQQIDPYHASLFGRLMVQDLDGRIKPINTLASEFLRKVSRKTYYRGASEMLDANQAFLAMHADPMTWVQLPLIKIDSDKGGDAFKDIKINRYGLISFNDLIDSEGNYILEEWVEKAHEKKPGERSEFDKEMLKVDERFNILFNVFSGKYLKIFPKRGDSSKTWYSYSHDFNDFSKEDAEFAKGIMPLYFSDIEKARIHNDWSEAENKIAYIKKYQDVLAQEIIPSSQRVEAEIWYNQMNLYFWLFQLYWILGTGLLVIQLMKIFSKKSYLDLWSNGLNLVVFLVFLLHTSNLILRWFVAQHAPWSNGYEMITFVAWSLMLFGLIYHKKSGFSLPLASLFAGTLLFVSYLDWLSPEITNLMPVLKSYWLKIHVATIISSYAPLALSFLLGLMALILMILKTDKNKDRVKSSIKELSYINEMSMTVGLFILTIGTFLGGVWANESWGRYWAWDPKETWALISIIVYATVLHLHLIPRLKNNYVLNAASVVAFFSIMMTSFGVNYYLTGLHSYATGDPVPIPNFIFILIAFVIIIFLGAYYKVFIFQRKRRI